MRLGHQNSADTQILNYSNCLYRQRLPRKKIYLAHTKGILTPNFEMFYYDSSFIYSLIDLLVEGSHGPYTVLGIRGTAVDMAKS